MEPAQSLSADAEEMVTAHRMAMRDAEVARDWRAALDHLQRSAELGLPLAQATLAALAGDWPLARNLVVGENSCFADWASLRSSIDMIALLAVPRPSIVSASPRIATIEGFASPEVCDWLIARARGKLAPAKVYDPATGGPRSETVRTNSEYHFRRDESDLALLCVRARMAKAVELPVGAMEATAILHYTPGQEFLPHFDFLDISSPGHAREVAEGGQRVLTFLLCLNDEYDGGETEFPALGRRWKGRKGSALFFWNVEPDGVPDRRTVHAGLPPARGEKWLLSQWLRARPTPR
jgi:prolyl 4-hydroxylase